MKQDNTSDTKVAVNEPAQTEDTSVSLTQAEIERPWVRPAVDVFEGETGLLLVADLPGVSRDTLTLTVDRKQLSLEGKWAGSDTGEALTNDWRPVNYRRTMTLPDGLDLGAVTARLDSGVLEIHLPLAAALKPRQIQVQSVN